MWKSSTVDSIGNFLELLKALLVFSAHCIVSS